MALTDPCKAREPRVIDNALIQKCIDYQYPKGETGRLMKEDGIPVENLEEIRLEFMHILKIDHLWVLKSLTKLQLNNNLIEKIENLDTLIHLTELNLSFNKISKIENLDLLENLEKLSFYENLIEKIENMDKLKKLTILSIGHNRICEQENIHYLRKFSKLTSLNMAHNPCAENEHFRNYIAVFLPQLVYYEYVKIDDSEREAGMEMFGRELRNLQRTEDEEQAKLAIIEREEADAKLHSLSFVEYLNTRHLFDELFEEDEDGRAFLDLGDEIEEFYVEYEEQFIDLCMQVFEVGQKHYQIRTAEIEQFEKTVEAAKKENQMESIGHMEEFLKKKNDMFYEIRHMQDQLDDMRISEEKYNDNIAIRSEDFNKYIHDTWKKLMKLELQLFEQVEEVNQNFEHILTDMINAFLEESQAIFSQIRALEVTYAENIGDSAGRFLTNANLNEAVVIPPSLKAIMVDKEALNNAVATSHDMHLQIIDGREDILVGRAKEWLEEYNTKLVKDEIKRNRYKLLEINHFLDIQREEFTELTADNAITITPDNLDDFI